MSTGRMAANDASRIWITAVPSSHAREITSLRMRAGLVGAGGVPACGFGTTTHRIGGAFPTEGVEPAGLQSNRSFRGLTPCSAAISSRSRGMRRS